MTRKEKLSVVALFLCACYLRRQVRSLQTVNGGLEENDREEVTKEG